MMLSLSANAVYDESMAGFKSYLESSKNNMFVLNLSNSTLIECVYKMCEVKVRAQPNVLAHYILLIKKIREVEEQFNCKIMPAMISSVFWNYFVAFLADQGIKYSSINIDIKDFSLSNLQHIKL